MRLLPDLALQLRLIRASRVFAVLAITISSLVIFGWIFNIDWLRRLPGSVMAMNPITALCVIMSGVAFLQLVSSTQNKKKQSLALIFSILVIGVGAQKLLSLSTGTWAIDVVFFQDNSMPALSSQMAPISAINFVLIGIALICLRARTSGYSKVAQIIALLIGLSGWLLQLGYLYQVPSFFGNSFYGPMALYSAFTFICISAALLLSRPDEGILRPLTRLSSGSIAIRLIMPAALLIPTVLGWLGMFGDWLGIYEAEFGVALYTLMFIIIFMGLAWYTAATLNARDIQRKEVNDALQKSEEELSSIFNGAPDAVVVVNEKDEIVKWNPEAEKLFLWTRQEAVGSRLPDLVIPEEFREAHARGMARFLATGHGNILGKTIDVKAIRKDKKEFDASIRISPIVIKGHHLFVGFIRDITESKQLQLKLSQFNEELKKQVEEKTKELTQIFERLTDGFIALDNEFKYTYLNKKAGQLINRDPEEMIGKYVWDVFPDAVGSSTYEAFNAALKEQRYVMNIDSYEPLGIYQENHIYPSETGLVVFIRDITAKKKIEIALKQREAKYRTLVEEAADAILVYSPQTNKYIEVNKSATNLFGYDEEEFKTKGPEDLIFPNDPVPIQKERLESGEVISVQRQMRRKDGSSITIETRARKLPDGNYLAFMRDVTERRLAEEETQRLNAELRKLTNHLQKVREEERTHIAREIHDELGQQLTVMKMDASYVNKKIGDDDVTIKEKMSELLKMIDHTVKSIRRISSELRPSLLDDLGLIAAMEWHLDEFERRSGISKEFHSELQSIELSDNIKINLFRIFQESLTNVARHSAASHVIVRLIKRDNEVILTITDNGKGFDKENAGKKTLGILGMKERTIMIGGKYDISGVAGQGTVVTVSIPAMNLTKQDNYA